jgi:hypothetical protein
MTRREPKDKSIEGVLSLPGKRKLTAAERLVDEQMLAMLEWASDCPDKWHKIGNLEATQKAAALLAKRGVIEIWSETNQYRLRAQK